MDKIRVLFLAANPMKSSRLARDEEARAIDEKIQGARYRDSIELVSHWAVRVGDLSGLMMRYDPHVVHCSGHGSSAGRLILHPEPSSPRDLEPVQGAGVPGASEASAPGRGWTFVEALDRLFEVLND